MCVCTVGVCVSVCVTWVSFFRVFFCVTFTTCGILLKIKILLGACAENIAFPSPAGEIRHRGPVFWWKTKKQIKKKQNEKKKRNRKTNDPQDLILQFGSRASQRTRGVNGFFFDWIVCLSAVVCLVSMIEFLFVAFFIRTCMIAGLSVQKLRVDKGNACGKKYKMKRCSTRVRQMLSSCYAYMFILSVAYYVFI